MFITELIKQIMFMTHLLHVQNDPPEIHFHINNTNSDFFKSCFLQNLPFGYDLIIYLVLDTSNPHTNIML